MPNPISPSEALREAQSTARPDHVEFAFITLLHATFATPIRVTNCDHGVDAEDGTRQTTVTHEDALNYTYIFVPLDVVPPGQEEGRPRPARIKIDNIRREIEKYLPAAAVSNSPVSVELRTYVWPDLVNPAHATVELELRDVTAAGESISAELVVPQLHNRPLEKRVYDLDKFPTLATGG